MCLTVCRERSIIYDNDRTLVCASCPLREKRDEGASCENCQHYQRDDRRELCLMTGMGIPRTRWCCHHNARRDLPYFPHRLNEVDGIVLVTEAEFQEALDDYLSGNPEITRRYNLASGEDAVVIDDIFDYAGDGDDDLWEQPSQTETISLNDVRAWDAVLHSQPQDAGGHRILQQAEAHQGVFIPIIVGRELVEAHQGVGGVIEWFESIFGGPEDILIDWRGRWVVRPVRLAIPGVYGVPATEWPGLIEDDLTDLLHDLFS